MKIGIIIQARMGSSRYPGKVLKKIYNGESLLDLLLMNLKPLNQKIIIATTKKKIDEEIIALAKNHNINYYCGDEDNVLKRFIECSKKFEISHIIRICADNIFIQTEFISKLIDNAHLNYDYMSYQINGINTILSHWGLFGEYITFEAMRKAQKRTNKKEYLEHVTNYVYTNPKEFRIKYWNVPQDLLREDVRLTIDTLEDFEICKVIIEYLNTHNLDWNYKNILNYLENNPMLSQKMRENIKKNKKL